MTNEELKKKIVEVVLNSEITGIQIRTITGGYSMANNIADALIAAGIGDIKRIANEEHKQAVQEFVEEFKSRYFFMMTTYMKNPIYQCTGDELDRLVKEVCGE